MMKCANCQTEVEIISETEHYCPKCDCTYRVEKGKKVKVQPADRLSQIEQNIQGVKETVGKIVETLKPKKAGEPDPFFWGKQESED